MVEFAIIIPMQLTEMLAIYQFGVLYNNWVTLTDAARAGARQAAVCRAGCSPDPVTRAKQSAADLNWSKSGASVTLGYCTSGTCGSGGTATAGGNTTVCANYPYSIKILLTVKSGTLTACTTERVE
jgi:hypothetical protein